MQCNIVEFFCSTYSIVAVAVVAQDHCERMYQSVGGPCYCVVWRLSCVLLGVRLLRKLVSFCKFYKTMGKEYKFCSNINNITNNKYFALKLPTNL